MSTFSPCVSQIVVEFSVAALYINSISDCRLKMKHESVQALFSRRFNHIDLFICANTFQRAKYRTGARARNQSANHSIVKCGCKSERIVSDVAMLKRWKIRANGDRAESRWYRANDEIRRSRGSECAGKRWTCVDFSRFLTIRPRLSRANGRRKL